jgi:hypothetical protein
MNITQLTELENAHLAAWNEKEPAKRIELLEKIYAPDIRMYDKDFILEGVTSISDFIGKISQDPTFYFSANGTIEPLQDSARLYGTIQTSGGLLNSMDFFLIEEGMVKHYYAFMAPA